MARLTRNHRLAIYRSKRDWGLQVTLYRVLTNVHDVLTGSISRSYEVIDIERAPVLSKQTNRKFVYDLAYIAADKNFTEGAFFDQGGRVIILDARDLPKGFKPNLDDFIVFRTFRYEIKSIETIEELAIYHLSVLQLENQNSERWITAKNKVTLTNAAG